MAWERLHITHASMGHMSYAASVKAYSAALEREPDIATFTESHASEKMKALRQAAKRFDYNVIDFRGSCAAAVRTGKKYDMYLKGKDAKMAHEPKREGLLAGYVCQANLKWHGHNVVLLTGHWPSRAYENQGIHRRMTRMMGAAMQRGARGEKIAFITGDFNADPDDFFYPKDILRDYKIKSWQTEPRGGEIGTLRTRGGRSIDLICRYGGDNNVRFVKRVVHPKTASDHIPVSVWYDIRSKAEYRFEDMELTTTPVWRQQVEQDVADVEAVEEDPHFDEPNPALGDTPDA